MRKGLKQFQKVYDIASEMGWLALDLSQNLSFIQEFGDGKITEEDIHRAYGLTGSGRKYSLPLMESIHELAKVLGYIREDYIENADKRQKRGNVSIYIAGQGSINTDMKTILKKNRAKKSLPLNNNIT